MSRDSFILYTIHKDAWRSLSDEDAGRLIKAILDYQCGEPVSLPPVPSAIFAIIKAYLDRDAVKWAQTVEKRRQAGAKGGAASGQSRRKQGKQPQANEANASFAKQTKQEQANEANPSCNDVFCFDLSLQDPCVEKNSHTHKIYGGTGACASLPPLNGEDIVERQDAASRERQRGDYEFNTLRDEYNRVKREAPFEGRAEFMRLFHSKEWGISSLDEIIAGLDRLASSDRGFVCEERFRPGLAKFLSTRMWTMEARSPDDEGIPTPEQAEQKRMYEESRRQYEAKMAAMKAARS